METERAKRILLTQEQRRTKKREYAATKKKERNALADRIGEYLGNGGLHNPECMEHEKVRDLLIACRNHLKR